MNHRLLALAATLAAAVLVPAVPALADGSLDTTFGGGSLLVDIAGPDASNAQIEAIAEQPGGGVLLAARRDIWDDSSSGQIGVARVTSGGALDDTFGDQGVAGFDVPGAPAGATTDPEALAVDSAGRTLVAGVVNDGTWPPSAADTDIFVVRLTPSGAIDTTFGTDGSIVRGARGTCPVTDVAIRDDGDIVALGSCGSSAPGDADVSLTRLLPDGSYDPAFAQGDKSLPATLSGSPVSEYDVTDKLALSPSSSGRMFITAEPVLPADDDRMAVVAFDATGALDGGFGEGGVALGGAGMPFGVAVTPDGRPVEVGTWYTDVYQWYVDRWTTAGTPDTTYGDGGRATLSDSTFSLNGAPSAPMVAPDGAVFVLGQGFIGEAGAVSIVRLTPAGVLDTSFGNADGGPGRSVLGAAGYDVSPMIGLVQRSGRFVAIGRAFRFDVPALSISEGQAPMALVLGVAAGSGPAPIDPNAPRSGTPGAAPQPRSGTTPAPAPFTITTNVPSAARCVSRRDFAIRLRPRGVRLVSARVYVNRRLVVVRKGARLRAPVNLRGLPRGTFTVTIRARDRRGWTYVEVRRYHTCREKLPPSNSGRVTVIRPHR